MFFIIILNSKLLQMSISWYCHFSYQGIISQKSYFRTILWNWIDMISKNLKLNNILTLIFRQLLLQQWKLVTDWLIVLMIMIMNMLLVRLFRNYSRRELSRERICSFRWSIFNYLFHIAFWEIFNNIRAFFLDILW